MGVDLSYFFMNSLLIEVLTVFTLQPALILFDWARVDWLIGAIGPIPVALQVLLIVLLAKVHPVLGAPGIPCGAIPLVV